jgi:hypothetical protein
MVAIFGLQMEAIKQYLIQIRSLRPLLSSTTLDSRINSGFTNTLTFWLRDASTSLTFNNFTFCDLCRLQHKQIGFYNRDEMCLQRGTDWAFK